MRLRSGSPWLRRIVGLSIASALVVVAVAFAVFGFRPDTGRGRVIADVSPSATPVSTPAGIETGSAYASARPSASGPPSASPDLPAPPDAVRSGPGVTRPGISLQFGLRTDGGFDVAERVLLRSARAEFVLAAPRRADAGNAFSRSRPLIVDLQAETGDGQPLAPNVLGDLSGDTTITANPPIRRFELRYRLLGTSVRSIPSTAGRALAFIRPVAAGIDPALPVQLSAAGVGALNLTCPQLQPRDRACARGVAPALHVGPRMTAGVSTVVVQVDVPEP